MSGDNRGGVVRFGVFEVDLQSGELARQGRRVRLPRQSFLLLRLLLERPGQVVTREAIRQALWPDGLHVDYDHGLNNVAARLRRALGDVSATPRFIETLPRVGYRFIAPVSAMVTPTGSTASDRRPAVRTPRWAPLAAVGIFAAGLWAGVLVTPHTPPEGSRESMQAPSEARAQAERSLIYTRLVLDGDLPAELVHRAAESAATRALTMDSTLADAHVAAGYTAMWGRWDWAAAARLFESAVALDPSSARARHARALWLAARGRPGEARAEIEQARVLDPGSADVARDAALLAYVSGDAVVAVERLHVLLSRDPDDSRAHELMTEVLSSLGRNEEAADHFRQFLVLIGISDRHARDDMRLLAANGMAGLIRRNLSRPSNKPRDRYGVPFKLASSHAFVGEIDAALGWLQQALTQRDSRLLFLNIDPRFESLRDDPRFQSVLARVGL